MPKKKPFRRRKGFFTVEIYAKKHENYLIFYINVHSSMRSGMVITLRNVVSSVVLTAVSRSPSNISANVSESEADGIAVTIYAVIATERSSPGKSLKSAKLTANAASGDTTSLMRQVTYTLTSVKSEANFTSARRIPRIIIDSGNVMSAR